MSYFSIKCFKSNSVFSILSADTKSLRQFAIFQIYLNEIDCLLSYKGSNLNTDTTKGANSEEDVRADRSDRNTQIMVNDCCMNI